MYGQFLDLEAVVDEGEGSGGEEEAEMDIEGVLLSCYAFISTQFLHFTRNVH